MTSTLARPRTAVAAIAALAVAAAPLLAAPAYAADVEDPVSFDTGHIDAFNLALNPDGSIRLNLKEDVTGSHVEHSPEKVTLVVKQDAHREGLPAAYLPPGAPTSLWYLPLTQDSSLLWPGWDSMGAASVYGADADVDIVISEVDGPGDVYLWTNGVFGDIVQLLQDDWKLPATIHQSFLAHTHANWGFTAAGTYTLTARATITSQDGTKTSTSDAETYTFQVGEAGSEPEPEPEPQPSETTLSILGLGAHYHTGDVAALFAIPSPESASYHYHWFTRPNADAQWTVVDGADTDTYGFVVTAGHEVKAAIYDHDHNVIAESEPVRIRVDDHGSTPGVGPQIATSLAETEGALVISVASGSERSELSDLQLNAQADRYVSEGTIGGITVTDTRSGAPGWSASGRVRALGTIDGAYLDGKYIGWTPKVVSSSAGQTVTAGPVIAPGYIEGNGIKGFSVLGTSAAGSSTGTAVLGADIRIEAPTTTRVGDYTGVVLITVI
ncbi:choice-of-anchor M domain-containing protein [Microbacterium sp. BWT-B31]|uniref:choice-of-anchor M domain-containing protein n=1 Tax=Microbacterium sp. BWT-B31 TaxID=3232072 RepID=UPI0035283B73